MTPPRIIYPSLDTIKDEGEDEDERDPAKRFSTNSNLTVIEPFQQQNQLVRTLSAVSMEIQSSPDHDCQVEEEDLDEFDIKKNAVHKGKVQDENLEHERKLRLIEANRTRSRLALEETSVIRTSFSSSSSHSAQINPEDKIDRVNQTTDHQQSIKIEIIMGSINQSNLSFDFEPHTTILKIKQSLYKRSSINWNHKDLGLIESFNSPSIKVDQLRLVYMGRYLNDQEILKNLRLARNGPTIFHLVVKPEESVQKATVYEGYREKFKCQTNWLCCCLSRNRPPRRSSLREDV
ncbi:hypothetical protein O181_011827 [Austropuccinia psidii MF-1]|uniref:Ubiquitin-like domain-containing protein n=1 Tax=Austropuccinia psidii MF-1 TaxID=1389203 RepID=A0A9Q3BWG5_9BASI|nr:hypothetical protein [Austropuccinia psidii MF-1]